jgi:hypothetical protein
MIILNMNKIFATGRNVTDNQNLFYLNHFCFMLKKTLCEGKHYS